MNTEDDKLYEDDQLSSLYEKIDRDMPPAHIDAAILAAAKRKTSRYSLPYAPFSNNWRVPASLAAVLVISFGIVTLVEEELTPMDEVAPLAASEAEKVQPRIEMTEEVMPRKLAKAPLTAPAKPAMSQPSIQESTASDDKVFSQGQLASRNLDIARTEQQRKNKQATRKLTTTMTDQAPNAIARSLDASTSINGTMTTGIDAETTLPYWQYQNQGISIRLRQHHPDKIRRDVVARGFTNEQVDRIAQSCAFHTELKNLSTNEQASDIVYNIKEWTIYHQTKRVKLKTTEESAALDISAPTGLAFKSSMLPTSHNIKSGDYQSGLIVFDLTPTSTFTLTFTWQQFGEQHSVTMPEILCDE